MAKIIRKCAIVFLCVTMMFSISGCGVSKHEKALVEDINVQINHIYSMAWDGVALKTEATYNLDKREYTMDIYMPKSQLTGYKNTAKKADLLNMEMRYNSCCESIKSSFVAQELNKWVVVLNVKDADNTIWYTSVDGIMSYSAFE